MSQCEACLGRGFHWRCLPCSKCDGSGLVDGERPSDQRSEARAQIKLRLRESLRAELAAAAERNEVSLNAEVVLRLRESLGWTPIPRRAQTAPQSQAQRLGENDA